MDYDRLTKVFVRIRDARAELKRQYEAQDAPLKAQLERIEGEMMRVLNALKVDSMRTEHGTFYRQEEIKPAGADWDALYQYIVRSGNFEMLERRIKTAAVKDYMDVHEGAPPPGVNVHRQYVTRVRRNT